MRFGKAALRQAESDLTPMIDVVFQLIIFFMLIINFADLDRAERIQLPVADQARPLDRPPEDKITLNVDKDGDVIWLGDAYFKKAGYSGLDEMLKFLRYRVSERMKGSTPAQDPSAGLWTIVLVRGDKRATCGDVQKIMAKCQQYSLNKFALRAQVKVQD